MFSFTDFCEMRMAVSSRIFGIKVHGKKTDCFCPLADMLNHRRPRQTQWYFCDELNSFVIQAMEEINKDDEIFDSYGKKCNSRFFLNYGFIVEKNESNEFPYNVSLNKENFNYEFKLQLLESKKTNKIFRVQANLEDSVVKDFFSFLRFCCFNGGMDILLEVRNYYII
jgi:histone-lysine N-methyltransferase SETD3